MIRKLISRTMVSFCIAAVLAAGSVETFAASVDLNGQNDFTITAAQDRDLFSNMKNMMPGATESNTVTLTNNSTRAVTFYLKAYSDYEMNPNGTGIIRKDGKSLKEVIVGDKKFQQDLLELIHMEITVGGVLVYEGPATGQGDLVNADYGISLGDVGANSTQRLEVTITLPGAEMTNAYADAFAATDWMFIVEGTNPSTPPGGGGGGGGGNPDDGPGVVRVTDQGIPLGDADVNVLVDDGLIPLANLAKTGEAVLYMKQIGILLAILLVGLVVIGRARRRELKQR